MIVADIGNTAKNHFPGNAEEWNISRFENGNANGYLVFRWGVIKEEKNNIKRSVA